MRASQPSHISGSRRVAVVNICNATCGLWLGCSPLTEIPDASRPATIALRASATPAPGRVIVMLRRDSLLLVYRTHRNRDALAIVEYGTGQRRRVRRRR